MPRDFAWLWGAHGVSVFGSLVTRAALPFTAALALNATAAQMAVLGAADLVASLLVGWWAGAWVDRVRRRPLLIGCDIARALLLATVPIAALLGRLDLTLLIGVKFFAGAFDTLFDLARQAYVPSVVGERRLVEANARLSATSSAAEVSAFGVAGWLVQWLTGPIAIAVDAVSFVVSAALLGGIRQPESPPARAPVRSTLSSWWAELREGLAATFGDPLQRALAFGDAMLNLTFGLFTACYVLFVTRDLALAPGPLGLVFAVGGVSGLVAATFAPALGHTLGVGRAMVLGLLISSVGLAVTVFAPAVNVPLALALLVSQQLVGDGGWALYMIHSSSLRMARAPEALRGRIGAASGMLSVAGRLIGIVLGGVFGDSVGARGVLGVGAAVTLLAGVGLLRSVVGRQRDTLAAS